jgi:2-iminobutanoate/2-iminopropanoate deaminase
MKNYFTKKAPKAIGPYAQAIQTGHLLYCSGQTPIDPTTMKIIAEDITSQTNCVIDNLEAILEEAGLSLKDVVKTNVFLTTMQNFPAMNAVYALRFGTHFPARSTVAVSVYL